MPRRVPGFLYLTWRRLQNRVYDLRAWADGYCHASPYDPIPGRGGGCGHWRCARSKGHPLPHRFNNYVWDNDRKTTYDPVMYRCSTPYRRHNVLSMRDTRARQRWHAEESARRTGTDVDVVYRRMRRDTWRTHLQGLRDFLRGTA